MSAGSERSEGGQREGEQSEGEQREGEQRVDEQCVGEQSEGEKSEGEKSEGVQSEGVQSEGRDTHPDLPDQPAWPLPIPPPLHPHPHLPLAYLAASVLPAWGPVPLPVSALAAGLTMQATAVTEAAVVVRM